MRFSAILESKSHKEGRLEAAAIGRVEAKLDAIAKKAREVETEKDNSSENVARHALALIKSLDAGTNAYTASVADEVRPVRQTIS